MNRLTQIEAVRHNAAACCDCQLAETRKRVVFGSGNPQAKLTIVAEGPSAMDDQTGQPFTGPAGDLLDQVLAENGLRRQDIWLTNILKCRAAAWAGKRLKNRPPKSAEIKACAKWLAEELALISPTVILCMGSPSAKAVIRTDFRLSQERGIWFTNNDRAPFVAATYNPAFILRMDGLGQSFAEWRQTLINDIAAAKQKLTQSPVVSQLTLF